jgi:hypothetical protein
MLASEFFTPYNIMLVIPVGLAGLMLMPLLYRGLADAIMPWRELTEDEIPSRAWTDEERRRMVIRRNEERMASAREAWRRGDPSATAMIGRRRSDYEALGIPFPGEEEKNTI